MTVVIEAVLDDGLPVISHVEGVKQRLDLGLHVVKTDRGSRIVTRDA